MAAIAGLRGTGDWATDERPKNFRELILWRNPNGNTPIFALTARVQKESVDDAEFSWWDEPNDIIRVRINKAGDYLATDTTLVVDSVDPDATAANKNNVYGSALHLKPGDHLLVEPAADNATFDHEVVEVVSVQSATQFVVKRGAQGTTAAAIVDNGFLLKIGSAYAEGTAEAKAASRNPIKYSNYTQIFKTVYEVTGTASKTKLRTGDVLANERRRKMFDHARDIEMALLFGRKNETTGTNGKPLRTFDGIRPFVANTTILSTGWNFAQAAGNNFLDAVSPVFDWDTAAGDQRIAFCGNGALNALNKKIAASASGSAARLNHEGMEEVFGMKFQRFVLPQGTIFLKTHPLMNRHAIYKNSMFVLDFSALRYRPFRGRDTKFQDGIQAKGEDVVRGQWMTEAGLEVRAGGLTMAYIGGFGT